MKFLVCYTLLLGSWAMLSAQQEIVPTAKDSFYFERGVSFFPNQIDSCIYYFKKGLPYYKKEESWVKYVNCYNALGSCYYYKNEFTEWVVYAKKAMEEAQSLLQKDNDAYSSALHNLAGIYRVKGNYGPAVELYEEAFEIEEAHGTPVGQAAVLSNLGRGLFAIGDVEESKNQYRQALEISRKEFGSNSQEVAYSSRDLADLQKQIGHLDSAKTMYLKCLQLFPKSGKELGQVNDKVILDIYQALADIALQQNQEKTFFQYVDKAHKASQLAYKKPSLFTFNLLGQYYLDRKDWANAQLNYQSAFQQSKENFKAFERHTGIGVNMINLANLHREAGNIDQSLMFYQKSLFHFTGNFTDTSQLVNPALADLNENIKVLDLLEGKAKTLLQGYRQKPIEQAHFRDQGIATYLLAIQYIRQLRQGYLASASKTILAEKVIPIFEGAMEALYQKYQETNDTELVEQLFRLSESSKAIVLLESIQENTAKVFAGIPDSLLQKEQELKLDITFYQKKILESKSLANQEEKIQGMNNTLFQLRRQYQSLIQVFEEHYPAYHQIKYDIQTPDIAQVQSQLTSRNDAYLEYFVGNKNSYLIYISQEETKVLSFEKTQSLLSNTDQLRQLLQQPPEHETAAADYQRFTNIAHQLYRELLAPLHLPAHINRLLLTPDDFIGYIPFEVLLQQAPASDEFNYSPDHLDYLINRYQISYNYSATLWLQNLSKNRKEQAPENFIGFAPSFKNSVASHSVRNCESEDLYNLECNEQEVTQVGQLLAGTTFSGLEASKTTFLQKINNYRIVHLATHSCLDDENPMNNKIFLTDDYLSHFDLSNLELRADLAVLSACNTGNGPLLRGEGVMSLSRGFMLAGCPSTLISLWSVEDCTTADIMQQYYEHLYAGTTKDQALREAKLHFLKQADRLQAHPFYWAPFVQFGDQASLDLHQSRVGMYLLAGLGGLLFLFVASRLGFFSKNWPKPT